MGIIFINVDVTQDMRMTYFAHVRAFDRKLLARCRLLPTSMVDESEEKNWGGQNCAAFCVQSVCTPIKRRPRTPPPLPPPVMLLLPLPLLIVAVLPQREK